MLYLAYIIMAAIVVVLSIKISDYVDNLDRNTLLSGAFLGGIMLSGVTSLPELFTSVSATALLGHPELCVGNVLGSDLFNFIVQRYTSTAANVYRLTYNSCKMCNDSHPFLHKHPDFLDTVFCVRPAKLVHLAQACGILFDAPQMQITRGTDYQRVALRFQLFDQRKRFVAADVTARKRIGQCGISAQREAQQHRKRR